MFLLTFNFLYATAFHFASFIENEKRKEQEEEEKK